MQQRSQNPVPPMILRVMCHSQDFSPSPEASLEAACDSQGPDVIWPLLRRRRILQGLCRLAGCGIAEVHSLATEPETSHHRIRTGMR